MKIKGQEEVPSPLLDLNNSFKMKLPVNTCDTVTGSSPALRDENWIF